MSQQDPLRMVRLKNGSENPFAAVQAIYISLRDMATNQGIPGLLAMVDLATYARGGEAPTGRSLKILQSLALIERDGSLHDITRDVVQSAVQGESLGTNLVSPYAE